MLQCYSGIINNNNGVYYLLLINTSQKISNKFTVLRNVSTKIRFKSIHLGLWLTSTFKKIIIIVFMYLHEIYIFQNNNSIPLTQITTSSM